MASTPEGTLLGGFADYRIGEVIGRGLAGELREARYLPSGLEVAIEEMPRELATDSAFRARLVAEGRRASRLRDPNALAVYDLIADDRRVALVVEHVDGTALAKLGAGSPVPAAAVLVIADTVLAALIAAHAAEIVHTGVSPEAVWVAEDGRVRLGGFAVGRALHPERDSQPATDTAGVASMTSALLGDRLEAGRAESGDVRRVRTVLRRGMSPDRRRRYRTASGMRAALTAAAADMLGAGWHEAGTRELATLAAAAARPARRAASAVTETQPQRKRSRRVRRVLAGAALVTGAVAAGILIGLVVAVLRGTGPSASAGLTVDPPLSLQVDPPHGSCDTTFAVTATGAVQGRGTLVYRWERSDGLQTEDTQLAIPASNSSFRITERWAPSGSLSQPTITFRIVSPNPMSVTQALPYSCP